MTPRLLKVKEVADQLGISQQSVLRLMQRKVLEAVNFNAGTHKRPFWGIKAESVQRLFDE